MLEGLRLHTVTHLRFFARSRLLLGLGLVLGAVMALSVMSFSLFGSSNDQFEMLKNVSMQLRWFAWFYTGAMGLFAFWWHTTQRTTTLVFTRPVRVEIWLASVFGSALLAALAIHVSAFVLTLTLSLVWGIPFQIGFLWLALDGVLESVVIVAILTGLSALVHPILAVLLLVFFSESSLYWIDTLLLGYVQGAGESFWLLLAEKLVRAAYLAVPILDPFVDRTRELEASLRVSPGDWTSLAGTAGYACVVLSFSFLFASYRLRRGTLN